MALPVALNGGDALVHFNTTVDNLMPGSQSDYALVVDGTPVHVVGVMGQGGGSKNIVSLHFLVTGLPPGNHDFEIHWKVDTPEGNARQLATTWGMARTLIVTELN